MKRLPEQPRNGTEAGYGGPDQRKEQGNPTQSEPTIAADAAQGQGGKAGARDDASEELAPRRDRSAARLRSLET